MRSGFPLTSRNFRFRRPLTQFGVARNEKSAPAMQLVVRILGPLAVPD